MQECTHETTELLINILGCDINLNVGIINMAVEIANQEFVRVVILKLWVI